MKASWAEFKVSCDATGAVVVLRVQVAQGFLARARGLIGRPVPAPGCGLLLPGVAIVHGIGMRYELDLVFLDAGGTIVLCAQLLPGHIKGCACGRDVLELRAGEIARLGLHRGMHVERIPEDASATRQLAALPDTSTATSGCAGRTGRAPMLALTCATLGMILASHQRVGAASPPGAVAATSVLLPAPVELTRPLASQTLQALEAEAEALYREDRRQPSDEAELLRIYESIAELAADRSSHAWLRIGNIHQRAGAVGDAIDAYRRLLEPVADSASADDAGAPPVARAAVHAADRAAAHAAQRKALLNLAGLALDQARQSLQRLQSLTASAGDGVDSYHRQLRSLEQGLARQQEPHVDVVAAESSRDARHSPYLIERYTASARRNSVKQAKGSLHLDPADELPARPIAAPRSRPHVEQLPRVEYLLGDPDRSKKAADTSRANERRDTGAGKPVAPRSESAGKRRQQ